MWVEAVAAEGNGDIVCFLLLPQLSAEDADKKNLAFPALNGQTNDEQLLR